MSPEVTAAIIGSVALLISSLVAAYATVKAGRAENKASKATDRVTNAEREIRELSATIQTIRLQISQNQSLQQSIQVVLNQTVGTSEIARVNFFADKPGATLDAKPPDESQEGQDPRAQQ
jgi:hypothetical protein